MSHRPFVLLFAPWLALASSCSEPAKGVLADVAWGLTCSGTAAASCNPLNVAGKSYDYTAYTGDVGTDNRTSASLGRVSARCQAFDLGGGNVRMSLRAAVAGSYIQLENLDINTTSGALIDSLCRASAYDGISLFGGSTDGTCTASAPSTGSPCQVTNVVVNHDDQDGPSIELRLNCAGLPNAALGSSKVSVRDSSDTSQPALIRFANCSGL